MPLGKAYAHLVFMTLLRPKLEKTPSGLASPGWTLTASDGHSIQFQAAPGLCH